MDETLHLEPGTCGLSYKACFRSDMTMMLDSSTEDEGEGESDNNNNDDVTETRLELNNNPLDWWKAHQTDFKRLSKVALRYLSLPPASVLSEQLFSGTGLIYDPQRNRLQSEKAAILLFTKYNSPVVKFNY
ncbi:zinc finger BED domain-containing protein 4-like [Eupeodes corollae]|uniref:zinc finger BED domain-containing protein 4-like n=1 Tax=Eupeodes corollae TaxID=290404 RepID=UPI0024936144|nr:zinc finger BED domain-containing protein 4-like [Eupeodes corollae]